MDVAVLTIPRIKHRIWALYGHLDTLGYPVRSPNLVKHYNGFDYLGYQNTNDVLQGMLENGYPEAEKMMDGNWNQHNQEFHHAAVVQWGMMNMLKLIRDGGRAVMILEDDAFFKTDPIEDTLTCERLGKKWQDLIDAVGYRNINLAQLFFYDEHPSRFNKAERVDDFWVKDTICAGHVANIYTPHGADYVLENKPLIQGIEVWLNKQSGNLEGVYSSKENHVRLHPFSNFDSPHVIAEDESEWWERMKGIDLQ